MSASIFSASSLRRSRWGCQVVGVVPHGLPALRRRLALRRPAGMVLQPGEGLSLPARLHLPARFQTARRLLPQRADLIVALSRTTS